VRAASNYVQVFQVNLAEKTLARGEALNHEHS
jgi:hypothetical protein